MGNEIPSSHFSTEDLEIFNDRLREETRIVGDWLEQNRFSCKQNMFGYELEAWLIDRNFRPAPINECFLQSLNDPLVVPELASFNIELNSPPQHLTGNAFNDMKQGLTQMYNQCRHQARLLDADMLMIGILPTVMEDDLSLQQMSNSPRYRALNEQIFRLRHGQPLRINIEGKEHLSTTHNDVMLEAATTSFQLHLQIPSNLAIRYYNAAIILSGPMVAATSNSPYLFGKHLWEETRIPLFEQSVSIGGHKNSKEGNFKRVSLGTGFATTSLLECFLENCDHFPVVLPVKYDEPPENLAHLRLHNGTIWRWNRPLIGFDSEGEPHLRIEHRVIPAGPSIIDTVANAAFFTGMMKNLVDSTTPPEQNLSFSQAQNNFYAAAQFGLKAEFQWLAGQRINAREHLLQCLLPLARSGLESLEINQADIRLYLDIIEQRIKSGQTGANWQQRFAATHDHDMKALTAAYAAQQQRGNPVHEWTI